MSTHNRLTEAERKAATKVSKDKYRQKPGVMEREREQSRLRSRKYRAETRAQLLLSRIAPSSSSPGYVDPAGVLRDFEHYARPIDSIKFPTSFAYFSHPHSNPMDSFFGDWEPSFGSCGKPPGCYPENDSVVDSFVERMVGRFAREQANLAELRYESVTSANDSVLADILREWEAELPAAVETANRWVQWKEASLKHPRTAHSRFVFIKQAWLCQQAYYLAEAIDFLSSGKEGYLAAWRDGRFKGSKAFLLSNFL